MGKGWSSLLFSSKEQAVGHLQCEKDNDVGVAFCDVRFVGGSFSQPVSWVWPLKKDVVTSISC